MLSADKSGYPVVGRLKVVVLFQVFHTSSADSCRATGLDGAVQFHGFVAQISKTTRFRPLFFLDNGRMRRLNPRICGSEKRRERKGELA
jgi:hypothetical protein